MAAADGGSLLDQLQKDGFVVVRSAIGGHQLEALREAARQATAMARGGQWPHIRTVGKQFPPWDSTPEKGIWGVQHLMHPNLPGSQLFVQLYFSDELLAIVCELLQCGDQDLVMELFNMLVRPDSDFELLWHRDDIPAEAGPDEEMERLARPAFHAQYNLALFEDESLILVPGSHRRPRTETEREADPFASHLPGQLVVRLEPGDVAFYNNNILHRGVYDSHKERMTLHGSVGHAAGSGLRARNVLQHGLDAWLDQLDLSWLRPDDQRQRAEAMRAKLIQMGSESGSLGSLGYSLHG